MVLLCPGKVLVPGAVAETIRVFLFIENRLLREALGRLFRKRPDLQVVGERGQDAVLPQEIFAMNCDVMAIDIFDSRWFPTSHSQEYNCSYRTVLVGMDSDSQTFLEAVKAGVSGYLLKDASASDVIAAIRATFNGEAVCPPKLCTTLFRWFAQSAVLSQPRVNSSPPDLTLRQRQLVNLVAKGLTNKEIAAQLNLSEFTVRNHIHRIIKQVHVTSRREAVDLVRAHGLQVGV
jgi:DNA-binding NarL/FixJ family response regulator